jgi:endoglucanase
MRPRSALLMVAVLGFLAAAAVTGRLNPAGSAAEMPGTPTFTGRRGIGVVQTFLFPQAKSGEPDKFAADPYRPHWSDAMPPARMRELAATGFDFLRIAVDPGPLLDADAAAFDRLLGEIKSAVDQTLAAGLKVVVDIHPSTDHPRWNHNRLTAGPRDPAFLRLVDVTLSLARALAAYDPQDVALELFNEPPPPCRWRDRTPWPDQLAAIYGVARAAAPRLTLLVAGACWASIEGLELLDPAQFNSNTMFVFHFYEPFVFTHQGFWGSDKYLQYVPPLGFPPDPVLRDSTIASVERRIRAATDIPRGEKDDQARLARRELAAYFDKNQGADFIARAFDGVAQWADRRGVARERIMLGEFGAMKDVYGKIGAAPGDRARWIAATRMNAERTGFRWAAWSLTNTMGIVTGDLDGPLDPAVLKALGLKAP